MVGVKKAKAKYPTQQPFTKSKIALMIRKVITEKASAHQ